MNPKFQVGVDWSKFIVDKNGVKLFVLEFNSLGGINCNAQDKARPCTFALAVTKTPDSATIRAVCHAMQTMEIKQHGALCHPCQLHTILTCVHTGDHVPLRNGQTDCCVEIPYALSMQYNNCPPGEASARIRRLILEGKNPCEVMLALHHELFHSWNCTEHWVTTKCAHACDQCMHG